VAAHDNRDPALRDCSCSAWHRLAPRQDAQAALIKQMECLGAAVARKRRVMTDTVGRRRRVAATDHHTDAVKVVDIIAAQ
jgi:hypothetical protein